jgi:hypothetical protein
MADTKVSEELWQEFHQVVNMTSRELSDWMRVQSADEDTEELPDQSGRSLGQRVLAILGKRAADLTDDDIAAMSPRWRRSSRPFVGSAARSPSRRRATTTGVTA